MSDKMNLDIDDQNIRWDDYNDQTRKNRFGNYNHKHPVLFDYMYFSD